MGIGSKIVIEALGKQDYHLYANPQITHFKAVFRRHTNFSVDYLKHTWVGKIPNFEDNNDEYKIKITKDGDLMGKLFLDVLISGKSSKKGAYTVNHFGNSLIKKVELHIGGYLVDTIHSQWLQIYHELTHDIDSKQQASSSKGGLHTEFDFLGDLNGKQFKTNDRLNGNMPLVFGGGIRNNAISSEANDGTENSYFKRILISLPFWFTKKSGMNLPLCALNQHEIELVFTFEKKSNLIGESEITSLKIEDMGLYSEMIHLSENEKYRFVQSNHEYIIEQHQHIEFNDLLDSKKIKNDIDTQKGKSQISSISCDITPFKHPVKYITWAINNPGNSPSSAGGNNRGMGPCYFVSMCSNSLFGNDGSDGEVVFKINSNDKERKLPMIYYTRFFPNRFLGKTPELDRIGFYSFCLNPLDIEPSGTCNFSKLTSSKFELVLANNDINVLKDKKIHFFAVNYNIFLIADGMGGLKYN